MYSSLNIIVVEDNIALLDTIVDALNSMGHMTKGVTCAESFDEYSDFLFDLLIVDLNLPGEDGISLTKRVRTVQVNVGIIMLTARSQLSDKLNGYENGADIYLSKPTSIEVLGAAIQALAKRIKQTTISNSYILDTTARTLTGPRGSIQMTADERSILLALSRALKQRLEYWQLMELFNSAGLKITKNALEVKVSRLRKKIIETGASESINVVRGVGYQLCIPIMIV